MKKLFLFVFLVYSIQAESVPRIFKGFESSDRLVIVLPDNPVSELRILANEIARKFSTVYPEDFIQEESYVERFKISFYSNYAVIMLGELKDFKLMNSYKFFPWRSFENGFYSVDYGFLKSGFSFVYTGDNPYSVAKDTLSAKANTIASTPFVLLSGDSIEAVNKSMTSFFEQDILGSLSSVGNDLPLQFSRLKANQVVSQSPAKQSIPSAVVIPKGMGLVGVKQGTLADFENIYQAIQMLPKQIIQQKYLPDSLEKYSSKTSLIAEENTIKVLEFSYEQQATAAFKKLKNSKLFKSYRKANKIYLYSFRP